MLYKTIKKSDYSPITKLNEGVHELMFLKTDLEEVNLCKILVDVFYGNITEKYVKDRVNKFINAETDWKIKSGFTWNDYKVWLSSENQFNYKAAYDLAVQTNGASLPVTFKFGDNDNPVYHEFTTLEELTDFYTKVLQYINTTLKEGWDKKDSIDWSKYSTNEGTKEDPIVYVPGMVLELGKYYIEGGIIYMCHKDSESIMKGNLKDYVDTYLTLISK